MSIETSSVEPASGAGASSRPAACGRARNRCRRRLGGGRPRRRPAARRGAALLSVGTLASGLLAYAFNVLAARSRGPPTTVR